MALGRRHADRQGAFSGNRVSRAIIDIGSNTVRLVLYGGSPRAPVVLFNEKVTATLGREIGETGRLADEAIDLAMRGLRRFALLLRDLDVTKIDVVATAAPREASNGPEFLAQVAALGFEPRLLSGEEEAETSAMGVIGAFPGATGIAADLGGGSLELVQIADDACSAGATMPLGTLRLRALVGADEAASAAAIGDLIDRAGAQFATGQTLYLVGGTWRAMAVFAMEQRNYPLTDPHGFSISGEEAQGLARAIARSKPGTLLALPRISEMRSENLPYAATLLLVLLSRLQPDKIVFSSWGLREGVLYSGLEPHARQQDPLLAGVGEFASLRGCPPVLATRVAGWTAAAVPASGHGSERLRLAATMLALSSMQIEPNLRIDLGIEWALHKRWISVSASDRALMAATVSANGNVCDMPDAVKVLASPDAIEAAICWGLAIRLCRRLGARSRTLFQLSSLQVEDDRKLVLSIEHSHTPLFGIPNEKDLDLLAGRLGLEPEFRPIEDAGAARAQAYAK
uniref:Ppx/GppA family phosphatase n=1 Tax=Parerythrobacter lutipelagi TaxID=1964208 RepID=UPI0010F87A5A|nr:Ppx/GppA family phosphatase [Parerythrobacter lutipelagi]